MVLNIKNSSGVNEYVLVSGEEVSVEVNDEDCLYFDTVRSDVD